MSVVGTYRPAACDGQNVAQRKARRRHGDAQKMAGQKPNRETRCQRNTRRESVLDSPKMSVSPVFPPGISAATRFIDLVMQEGGQREVKMRWVVTRGTDKETQRCAGSLLSLGKVR